MNYLKGLLLVLLAVALTGCQLVSPVVDSATALGEEQAQIEPPALVLAYAGGRAEANIGTYSWNWDRGDGTWAGVCADALHPLECEDYMQPISAADTPAVLEFEVQPDSFAIHCWPQGSLGDTGAETQRVITDWNNFELNKGGYIYEVVAVWENNGAAYHGTVCYYFFAGVTEDQIQLIT